MQKQKTIKREVTATGVGLFTGEKVKITLSPAKENTGIVFQRKDIENRPVIKADLNFVKNTFRRTVLGNDNFAIQTVEHLLSAVSAYKIDNILIQIEGNEVLVGDGSSKIFTELLEKAGEQEQNENKKEYILENPVYFSDKKTHIVALPADEYKISYTLHHPTNLFLKSQYFSYVVSKDTYKHEIAPSRTFSIYEEIKPLLDKNLIKGGGLDNAVVIKDNKVINPEGIRFSNEMVRHKILDLMGDLCLMCKSFKAHIIAICTSHTYNVSFAKKLEKYLTLASEENK